MRCSDGGEKAGVTWVAGCVALVEAMREVRRALTHAVAVMGVSHDGYEALENYQRFVVVSQRVQQLNHLLGFTVTLTVHPKRGGQCYVMLST
jgi:hypothetical protein